MVDQVDGNDDINGAIAAASCSRGSVISTAAILLVPLTRSRLNQMLQSRGTGSCSEPPSRII